MFRQNLFLKLRSWRTMTLVTSWVTSWIPQVELQESLFFFKVSIHSWILLTLEQSLLWCVYYYYSVQIWFSSSLLVCSEFLFLKSLHKVSNFKSCQFWLVLMESAFDSVFSVWHTNFSTVCTFPSYLFNKLKLTF